MLTKGHHPFTTRPLGIHLNFYTCFTAPLGLKPEWTNTRSCLLHWYLLSISVKELAPASSIFQTYNFSLTLYLPPLSRTRYKQQPPSESIFHTAAVMAPRYDSTGRRWESMSMHTASYTDDATSSALFETSRGREPEVSPVAPATALPHTPEAPDESVCTPSCAPTIRSRQQSNPYRIVYEGSPPPQVRRSSHYSIPQGDLESRTRASTASQASGSTSSTNCPPRNKSGAETWVCARCIELNPVTVNCCSGCRALRIEQPGVRPSIDSNPTAAPSAFSLSPNPIPVSIQACVLHGQRHCKYATCRSPPWMGTSRSTSISNEDFLTARVRVDSEASNTSTVWAEAYDPSQLRNGVRYDSTTRHFYDRYDQRITREEALERKTKPPVPSQFERVFPAPISSKTSSTSTVRALPTPEREARIYSRAHNVRYGALLGKYSGNEPKTATSAS